MLHVCCTQGAQFKAHLFPRIQGTLVHSCFVMHACPWLCDACMSMHMHICTMYVCMHVCMYACMYLHIFTLTHTHKQTHTRTHMHTYIDLFDGRFVNGFQGLHLRHHHSHVRLCREISASCTIVKGSCTIAVGLLLKQSHCSGNGLFYYCSRPLITTEPLQWLYNTTALQHNFTLQQSHCSGSRVSRAWLTRGPRLSASWGAQACGNSCCSVRQLLL